MQQVAVACSIGESVLLMGFRRGGRIRKQNYERFEKHLMPGRIGISPRRRSFARGIDPILPG
jgi:hypothetical protein